MHANISRYTVYCTVASACDSNLSHFYLSHYFYYTLSTDQLFNLEFQVESIFNLEFQPKLDVQLGIPIPMGINLGECMTHRNYEIPIESQWNIFNYNNFPYSISG